MRTEQTGAGSGQAPPLTTGARPKLHRPRWLTVFAVAAMAAGVLGGLFLWTASSTQVEVVAAKTDVERGHVITMDDLTTVRVSVDPTVRTLPAGALSSLVGQRAATDLSAGTLLSPDQVTDAVLPGEGSSLVAIPVASGLMPAEPLRAGDSVRLVQTPGPSGEVVGAPPTATATVLNVTPGDTATVVDVLVPADKAAELAARAATGRLALVLDSRER